MRFFNRLKGVELIKKRTKDIVGFKYKKHTPYHKLTHTETSKLNKLYKKYFKAVLDHLGFKYTRIECEFEIWGISSKSGLFIENDISSNVKISGEGITFISKDLLCYFSEIEVDRMISNLSELIQWRKEENHEGVI